MDPEDMDVYPIEHRGKIYNVITAFDMTFREVRAMIDWLDARNAFDVSEEDEFMGPGKLFTCLLDGATLEVDVQGFEIVVYRRTPVARLRET